MKEANTMEMDYTRLKNLWRRKKMNVPFSEFQQWHALMENKCCYCGITEDTIKLLLDSERLKTKRISTRGRKLELDRKSPELSYDKLDNIVLSCYWCNNAKTDTFTHEEFLEVGKVFASIWKERVQGYRSTNA